MRRSSSESSIDGLPRYLQVADDIICKIHDGIYPPGHRLPSLRTLAQSYGTSLHLMQQAILLLSHQNYLYTKPKSGILVSPSLNAGLFYRLGFVLNNYNPMEHGLTISTICGVAQESCFNTVLISNFNSCRTIADLLKRDRHFDGMLLHGEIDEALLHDIASFNIPYIVIGNYEIDASHPQCRLDIVNQVRKSLGEELRNFTGARVGALLGDLNYQADREALEGFKLAVRDSKTITSDQLIACCSTDGYHECSLLMQQQPDILYIRYSLKIGYQKFLHRHPDAKRSFVIYDSDNYPDIQTVTGPFDRIINSNPLRKLTENATRKLIQGLLDKRKTES